MSSNSTFILSGLDCADCAAKLEHRLQCLKGVQKASLNFGASKLAVEHTIDDSEIIKAIRQNGYEARLDTVKHKQVTVLTIQGLDCVDCAAKLENRINGLKGVEMAQINFASAKLTVRYTGSRDVILNAVQESGYTALEVKDGNLSSVVSGKLIDYKNLLTAASGVLLGLGFIFSNLDVPRYLVIAVFLSSILSGGYYTARSGIFSLKSLSLDMNFLMTAAVIGAMAIGEWSEGATVVFLFSLGNALQTYTMDKTRNSIRSLMELSPREALVRRNGLEQVLAVNEIAIGDIMIVKPGNKIAMDGRVLNGVSTVNQAPITGESLPVTKQVGSEVFAGTINENGTLEVEVTKLSEDTTLAKIINLVEEAQAQKAPSQQFIDVFARYYTPAVIFTAIAIAFIMPIVLGQPFVTWFNKALILLVVSCPCALVISTPVTIVAAIGNAARHGILIKGGAYLETAGSLKAIAFDKTGTLTVGKPEVTSILPICCVNEEKLLELAASVEARSQHPLAEAILRLAFQQKIEPLPTTNFQSFTGKGASAQINGETYYIGNLRLFNEIGNISKETDNLLLNLQQKNQTIVLIGTAKEILGVITISDTLREDSKKAIFRLKQTGIKHITMLTGDNEGTARDIASELELENWQANLLPQDKLNSIKALQNQYGHTAMVGDGINDAPALAAASVGIAMGGAGTDTALETADIVLMSDDLKKLPSAIDLSRRAKKIIIQNITFSVLIKAVFIAATFWGPTTLWMAVFADTGAAVLVILNGMRMLQVKL